MKVCIRNKKQILMDGRKLLKTKDKLEQVRMDKSMKEKKIVSLAQVIDELVDEYLKKQK